MSARASIMSVNGVNSIDKYPDRIAEFFEGKTVFITGGTGFLGKVLVEKLLRCCGGVRRIYLVIRSKKGKDPGSRLDEIFQDRLFDVVKKLKGKEIFSKVAAIAGDVEDLKLGISEVNRQILIDEVELVYHCAATIRFDEILKKAVILNVRGTRETLALAKEMKKLQLFCHVSTAYCHLHERILYEKAYPPPSDPHKVIATCEWLDEKNLQEVSKDILGDYPNSYAFTKALGESLVTDEFDNIPAILTRPTVVIPVYKEPLPGWTDNINGPGGLLIAAGKGVLRTMLISSEKYADYMPVDIVVNALLFGTYAYCTKKTSQRVFNLASSNMVKVPFSEIVDMGRKIATTKYPFNYVLWYPGGSMQTYRILHYLSLIFFQWIPALIADWFLFLLRFEPVLVRVQKRIFKGYDVFEYYVNRQWDFDTSEATKLLQLMNPKEKDVYMLEASNIDYYTYFEECTHQARLLMKETDDMLPAARRNIKIFWFLDVFCKLAITLLFIYFISDYLLSSVF